LVAASVVGWLIFQEQKPALIAYLHMVGFGSDDPAVDSSAAAIAAFSLGQAAWFLVLFAVAVGLVLLVITGYFNGPRARTGAVLLGGFMLFDLCRADLPWLTDWDYKQKCEVGSLNPIVKHLLEKPYEHRVAYALPQPLATPDPWQLFDKLYLIEWMQHIFPYYNIQSLDIVQMPRLPEDYLHYEQMFAIKARPAAAGGLSAIRQPFRQRPESGSSRTRVICLARPRCSTR